MFYIGAKVDSDETKLNDFLRIMGKKVIDIQMSSWRVDGGDTLDSIMVVFEEEGR